MLILIIRFTNIASLSLIASTYLEKEVDFWAAYLLPLSTVWMLIPLMLFWQKEFGMLLVWLSPTLASC